MFWRKHKPRCSRIAQLDRQTCDRTIAIHPVDDAAACYVERGRNLSCDVGLSTVGKNRCAHAIGNRIKRRRFKWRGGGVSPRPQHELAVAVVIHVAHNVGMRVEEVAQRLRFWLAKRRSASIGFTRRISAGSATTPLKSPVSIGINAECSVAIVTTVLAPQSCSRPGVLVAIRIHAGQNEDLTGRKNARDACVTTRAINERVGKKHRRHRTDPLARVLTCIKEHCGNIRADWRRRDANAAHNATFK